MNPPLLAANWKMYKNRAEAAEFCGALIKAAPAAHLKHVLLAPAYPLLETVAGAVRSTPILVAAQNCHWEAQGAFTGEVSAGMLKDLGVTWTLVGHSERRHIFGETDALLAKRLDGALKQGMSVIFCVGETLDERNAGATDDVLARQLEPLAKQRALWHNISVAYEPVWAIGTGVVATTAQVDAAHERIQHLCPDLPILYGGSVNPDNIGDLMGLKRVAGALIGGASLDAAKFTAMLGRALQVKGVQ
jgi:triosephosphate isomerase (TIM)